MKRSGWSKLRSSSAFMRYLLRLAITTADQSILPLVGSKSFASSAARASSARRSFSFSYFSLSFCFLASINLRRRCDLSSSSTISLDCFFLFFFERCYGLTSWLVCWPLSEFFFDNCYVPSSCCWFLLFGDLSTSLIDSVLLLFSLPFICCFLASLPLSGLPTFYIRASYSSKLLF